MHAALSARRPMEGRSVRPRSLGVAPVPARVLLGLALAAAAAAGFLAAGPQASDQAALVAGPELTRLLRAMAALKTMMAAALLAAVWWRLKVAVSPARLLAYVLAAAAMAAGPGLIWSMVHIRTGALLLHGGLLAGIVLLWRDPATATLLTQAVAARRLSLGKRSAS